MVTEVQRKPNLGDFDATELDSSDGVPFADRRPAVAAWRCAAARAGLKHMPNKISAGAGIFSLDRDPEAAAPSGHRAGRTGGRPRLYDCLDDLVRRMASAKGHRASRIGPDDGPLSGDHLQWPQRAGIFRNIRVA